MAPVRTDSHPLSSAYRLLFSRGVHLLLGTLAFAFCIFAAIDATKVRPNDGTIWRLGLADLLVRDVPVRQDGPQTPLRVDDRIVGIANRIVRSPQEAASLLREQEIGSTVPYLIERGQQVMTVQVPLTPFRAVDRTYLSNILVALAYLIIGFLVYLNSRNDEPSRLFFVMCLLFAVFFVTIQNRSSYFWGDIITQNGGALARFLLPTLFLHFFLVFPEKKPTLTRHPFLAPLLYLLPGMFYLHFTRNQFFGEHGTDIGLRDWLLLGLYFLFGLMAMLHSYFSYRDPLQKQRVRILTIGTLTAIIPFLVFKIVVEESAHGPDLALLGVLPMVAIPVSFGYCIARYRIMQIEALINRSLRYNLLTGLVILVYLICVLGLGALVLQLSGPTTQLVSVAATLGIAIALWPLRSRVQKSVDSKYFRAQDDLGQVLQEISKEIPRLIQQDSLLQSIGSRLCQVLALPVIGIYMRAPHVGLDSWSLAARVTSLPDRKQVVRNQAVRNQAVRNQAVKNPLPFDYPQQLSLQAIIRVIERRNEPFWIEMPRGGRPDSQRAVTREQAELALRLAEEESLARSGIALLVPLTSQGRLIGLFALPPKPQDGSYRLQELELMSIVAHQLALQLENTRLYQEEVAKQKLMEEIAMARTIQSRLLPSSLPQVPGLELDAVNFSSRHVSGDYYDFILKEDGCLGLVVSDVSGKGMPASLLASNLQAALRAQCDTGASPGTILARVNRQLHASTDPQHFATLFLAFFNPQGRTLCYSSGGHNAPVLLRNDGRVQLLEKGGLPLGAFDFGTYEEETINLDSGDLLVMYTDGLTESKSLDDEDFGTTRLEQILQEYREAPVKDIIATLHQEARQFSGRDEAEDDITLIVMRVTGRPTDRVRTGANGDRPGAKGQAG